MKKFKSLSILVMILSFYFSFGQSDVVKNLRAPEANLKKAEEEKRTTNQPATIGTEPTKSLIIGSVFDFNSRLTIPAAKIYIKEFKTMVLTDFDGSFKAEVFYCHNFTLEIHYPNMEKLVLAVKYQDESKINVGNLYLRPLKRSVKRIRM